MQPIAIRSATIRGVEAVPVTVEVDLSGGIPGITIVGMPDTAVLEARSRVRCAIRSAGFEIPRLHVTVNLAPSEMRKSGTCFDLAVAVGILAASDQIPRQDLDGCLFVGELSLDGEVCPARGGVAFGLLAAESGLSLVCGEEIQDGLSTVEILKMTSLAQMKRGVKNLPRCTSPEFDHELGGRAEVPDFSDVIDQESAKRAMVIAAAGHHGLLMMGPPGSGKTMLARRLPGILPPLDERERIEAMIVHSVAGLPTDSISQGVRPFRAPHHSVSMAGLIGGGHPVSPGEISLADKGVLFLDELPEFTTSALQALRQPLEDTEVRIVRADGSYAFPCDFLLVAAANPCPCGYLGDPKHRCRCTPNVIEHYQAKIGGPLMDRIDLHVDVRRPESRKVIEGEPGLTTQEMSAQVIRGRTFTSWLRSRGMGPDEDGKVAPEEFDATALEHFNELARGLMLTGRGISRVSRTARTIANIAEHEHIASDDVIEACSFRSRARG